MYHIPRTMIAITTFVAICGLLIVGFEDSDAVYGEYDASTDILNDMNTCNMALYNESAIPIATGVDSSNVVATIDGVDYYSFNEAVSAAETSSSKRFTLLNDVDLTSEMSQGDNIDVTDLTIDLGGNIVKTGYMYGILVGTDFTIRNGIIDGQGENYGLWIGDDEPETRNAVIENVTVYGGINIYHAEDVVLRNVTAGGIGYYAVWCDDGGNVTIESGYYSSGAHDTNALLGISSYLASMNITGGTFEVADGKRLVLHGTDYYGDPYADPVITGGTFINIPGNEHIEDYVPEGYKATLSPNGTFEVNVDLGPPIYDDDDDWYPVYPTVTDNNSNDDSKTAVACAAAAVVAALMAAFLVIDSRKDR